MDRVATGLDHRAGDQVAGWGFESPPGFQIKKAQDESLGLFRSSARGLDHRAGVNTLTHTGSGFQELSIDIYLLGTIGYYRFNH